MGLPSSGDPAHNASLAPAPARTWRSLFARRGDPSAAIAGFQRRLYGGHRRPDVPLAGGSLADHYSEEQIQRGPKAFVATTCQTLAKFQSNGSPVQDLLDSASSMFSTKLVYNEADKRTSVLIRRSEKSLHSLFVALNYIFSNLEVELRKAGEPGAILSNHDDNSFELFQRLPEADVQSSAAISLIYDNLQKLDNFLSSQLSSHKKPRKMTTYWLPYTFGALGISAFSLWLLRHSSLMGSSDIDNWIHGAKEFLVWCWDENVQKPVSSIWYLANTLQQSKGVTGKQGIQLPEDPLSKCGNISSFLHERAMLELEQVLTRRGRTAQGKRRQLLSGVEEMLTEFQQCMANGMEEEAHCTLGLLLMKEYIFCLADPRFGVAGKRDILLRLRNYKCLSPPSTIPGRQHRESNATF
uniref:Uncharacterized protein n=1 Tax=Oryza punctata TaxID=4537 RepID=A0A0E0KDU2_ORYPU